MSVGPMLPVAIGALRATTTKGGLLRLSGAVLDRREVERLRECLDEWLGDDDG